MEFMINGVRVKIEGKITESFWALLGNKTMTERRKMCDKYGNLLPGME